MINVEEHLGLVTRIAKKYSSRIEYDDAFQIGCEGLVKASKSFDETKGYTFSTYAVQYIQGYIMRYLRDNNNIIKPTRSAIDLYVKIKEMEKDKTLEEISKELKIDYHKVVKASKIYEPLASLDFEIIGSDGGVISFSDTLVEENNFEDDITNSVLLQQILDKAKLKDIELEVIKLRFVDELTQDEIALKLDIYQVQVSRIIRRAIKKLRNSLGIN